MYFLQAYRQKNNSVSLPVICLLSLYLVLSAAPVVLGFLLIVYFDKGFYNLHTLKPCTFLLIILLLI